MNNPDKISDLSQTDLVRFVPTVIRRIALHNGIWFSEVIHHLGLEEALDIEEEAASTIVPNITKRIGKALESKTIDGAALYPEMKHLELIELITAISISWLASDGVWFQTVESRHGMAMSKLCNDSSWKSFSPLEASIIRSFLDLPEQSGLEGLRRALGFRLYASINVQTSEIKDDTLYFYINRCRVQGARQRKGLADYPCKSVGIIEYTTFASTIDSRIKTKCIACPPDEHPADWVCAWEFTVKE